MKQIKYATEKLRLPLNKTLDPPDYSPGAKELLKITKSAEWKYEREHRLFVDPLAIIAEGGLQFCRLGADVVLREVILGHECSVKPEALRAYVNMHVAIAITYSARLARQHFKVVPEEDSVP